MKVITWNCNMAFRKKKSYILKENPDILIIQECEYLDKINYTSKPEVPSDSFWFGDNLNKGIGVFTYFNYKIKVLPNHNKDFRFVLPLEIFNDLETYFILAVWTQKPDNHDCYTEQIWNAINYYYTLLGQDNVMITGDFNSNAIWDKSKRLYNHTNLVKLLESKNIYSAYHCFFDEKQGRETQPTLYFYKKKERPYHIDYCFLSKRIIKRLINIEVGVYENWIKYSDHVPIILNFKKISL